MSRLASRLGWLLLALGASAGCDDTERTCVAGGEFAACGDSPAAPLVDTGSPDGPTSPDVLPTDALPPDARPPDARPAPVETPPPTVSTEPEGAVDLHPPTPRDRHRVDIDQLDALIEQATGVPWGAPPGFVFFEKYAASLGVPDYLARTSEDLEPNLLFMKLLSDASKFTCARMIDREIRDPAQRRFFVEIEPGGVDPARVSANMRHALLRFHGWRYAEDDPRLAPWIDLFDTGLTLSDADPNLAWEGICIALIRHPDFYSL